MSFPRRHFWVFHLLTILVCAFFAARATGQLVAGLLLDRMPTGRRMVASTAAQPEAPLPTRSIGAVVSRNIFCSTCEASAASEGPSEQGAAPDSDAAPTKTSLKLRLLATLVPKDDPGGSIAFIVELDTGQTGVHGVGSKLGDGVTVLEIALRQVLIRNGQRKELLTLGDGEAEPMPTASEAFKRPDPLEGLEDVANGIRQVADRRYAIDRATLQKVLADSSLFTGVRVIPSVKDGQTVGFAVYAKVGSIPSLLGIFGGDVLQSVNGQAITTPEKAREVIRGLLGASQMTLSFVRRGVPLTHDYLIR
jgi:type II secretory pathway component PulC